MPTARKPLAPPTQPPSGPPAASDSNTELSRKKLLGRAAVLAGGVAAFGFPGTTRAAPLDRKAVRWNSADGTFQSEFVTKSPASPEDNLIQPLADIPALTLKSSPGATSRLGEFQRADGTIFASIHPGWDVDHNGRFELRNVGTGHGAHAWTHMLATFNGTQNPAMYIGYNVAGGGTPIVYGEPYVCLAIEGDYNNGTQRDLEIYFEAQNAAGTIQARPVAAILKRDATTKETFAYWTSIMGKDIAFLHPKAGGDVESLRIAESYFQVQPIAGNHTIFRIRAPASRTSQLFLGYGGTDDVFAISPEATTQTAITVGNPAVTAMTIFKAGAGSAMCLGGSDNNSALTVINNAFGGGGNILTLQDASAVTKWFVDTNGNENHAEGTNIVVGTTIGTKIGTAVTQKLGFFGVVPVAQRPSHGPLTAASGFGSRERNMLNDVYSGLRALGLLA